MAEDYLDLPLESEIAADPAVDEREAPIGLYQRDDEELVKQIRMWWKESADARVDSNKKVEDELKMLAGDQWDQADKTRMQDGKRPALTLNLLQSMMAAVEGQERNNRQEIKLYGEGAEDDSPAWSLNRIIKWVMNQCRGEFTLSKQFRYGASVGESFIGFEVDYFEDPEGIIKLAVVDGGEAFPDPLSTDPTASDMRYFHRVRMYGADELEARWPGATAKLRSRAMGSADGPETDGKGFRDIYLTPDNLASPKYYDAAKRQWAVLESWWMQIEPGRVVVDEVTGMLVEKTEAEYAEMVAVREAEQTDYVAKLASGEMYAQQARQHADLAAAAIQEGAAAGMDPATIPSPPQPELPPMPAPIDSTQRPIRRVYQAFSSYETLLSKEECALPTIKRIPYVSFRSMWDSANKSWYGLLRALIDMQKQHNVEQSAMVQLVQLMPKASWMGPKGAFHNKHEWEQKIAQPGSMLEYNGRVGKPEQIQTPAIPRHLVDMAMSRPSAMREISGINVELAGIRAGSDPGVVMEQRSKAALTVLAPIFDNFRESKKETGKILLAYIQKYVTVGRKIRVIGPEGAKDVQMTEDMTLGRYDLMVEETNATINDRIAALTVLQTTLPQMLSNGIPVAPELVDLLPMDPHIRDAQKRMVAWSLLVSGQLPPPDWKPGMPDPRVPVQPPPGAAPPTPVTPPA